MKTNAILLVLYSSLLNATAQLLFKTGMIRLGSIHYTWANCLHVALRTLSNPFVIAGLVCYMIATLIWLLALSRIDVAAACPMGSIAFIIIAIAAYYLFDEPLSLLRLIGIGVIILGVYLVAQT